MPFEPWMLAAIDEAGYNGITEEHIERVAAALKKTGLSSIDRCTFERVCRSLGIDPNIFSQDDIAELGRKLNE